MRLTKKLIENTVSKLVGEDVYPVVEYLKDKEDISEFKIATKLGLEIHYVRNVLYRLNNHNIATYIRKKDRVKGWYISYWTLNTKRIKECAEKLKETRIVKLKEKLAKEQQYREGLYICPNICTRLNFERAMEENFKCKECGSLLHSQDNSKTIENLKSMINELEVGATA